MRAFPQADAVVRGDAEAAVEALARRVPARGDDLADVPNLVWRRGAAVVDNGIGFVADGETLGRHPRTRLDLVRHGHLYAQVAERLWFCRADRGIAWNLKVLGHVNGFALPFVRGCPFGCIYCGGGRAAQEVVSGRRRLAVHPVARAAAEVEDLARQGVNVFFTEYVPLGDGDRYWLDLFEAIGGRGGPRIAANVECRALPSPAFVEAFATAFGGRPWSRLNLSPDAAREESRARVKEGIAMSDRALAESLDLMERLRVRSELYYTVGLPGETAADVDALDVAIGALRRRYARIEAVRVHTVELDPASPMYLDPGRFGLRDALASFEDYRRHHARRGSMLSGLGYGAGIPRAEHERRAQETICDRFCRLSLQQSWRAPAGVKRAVDLAARAACETSGRARGALEAAGGKRPGFPD